MVRLVAQYYTPQLLYLLDFNSSMVRLVVKINVIDVNFIGFQFQYGAIGSKVVTAPFRGVDNFNSSMVRLVAIGFQLAH